MTEKLESLADDALTLAPEDRVELAHRLIASVFPDEDIENAWGDEVDRRVHEIESGRSSMVPATEAIARARSSIK